jgi:serine/threonine protein kinase
MIGTILNHYRILRTLGQGGMGEVYAAEDTRLNRTVALKVLPHITSADSEDFKRFRREAQAVAALTHPNVVTLYSVEDAGGVPFLTMELVDGKPLDAFIPRRGMTLAALLEFAIPLADAIGAAHQRGIVHRDLKPSNIMIGGDRRLKVLDFGLAKLRQETAGEAETLERLTAEHRVIGTAAYMSPEQAEGRAVDHRSDIFSLGILLYEMATGTRPFTGESTMSILSAIIKDTPTPPMRVNAAVPDQLDRIIRRCLAKDPSRRYQSAVDVRNDLEEIADAEPASRHRSASIRRAAAWSALAIGASLAAGAAAVEWRARADRIHPAAFARLTSMPGREWFPSLSPDGKWIVYAAEVEGNFDIFLQSVSGSNAVNLTKDSPDDDEMPAFSPDGDRIAFRSGRDGGGIFVMGRTGEAIRRITRAGFNPSWSPDGTEIAFTSLRMDINPQNGEGSSELEIVSAGGGEPRRVFGNDVVQPVWSPHRRRIAFARRGGAGRSTDIWTIRPDGSDPVGLTPDQPIDWNPVWAPDGAHLYFLSDRSGTMNLWRIAIDEETGRARGEAEPIVIPSPLVAHPAISADGRLLAYSSVVVSANIQRLTLAPGFMPSGDPSWVTTGSRVWANPDPSPDGDFVTYYSRIEPEGHLYISRADGTGQRQLTGDAFLDRMPRWAPDGKWISFFSNRSGRLQIWKIRSDGGELQPMTQFSEELAYPLWSPDARRLAAVTISQAKRHEAFIIDATRPWNPQERQTLPPVPGSPSPFTATSWSPDGQQMVGFSGSASPSSGVIVFALQTQRYERMTTNLGEWPVWMADNRHVLMGDGGKHFWLLDTKTKEARQVYSGGRDVLGPPRPTIDGRAIFYPRRVTESDIHLMTLR